MGPKNKYLVQVRIPRSHSLLSVVLYNDSGSLRSFRNHQFHCQYLRDYAQWR